MVCVIELLGLQVELRNRIRDFRKTYSLFDLEVH